ncbi:MAG: hypothetical protein RJB66_929 [Pseudomonadota bacterium]|jgi:hypothetical protein
MLKTFFFIALTTLQFMEIARASEPFRFVCKGHTPLELRLHLTVINESRAAMTIDSIDLYPHTGGSWRLLLERISGDTKNSTMVPFTTYDDSFIYHTFIPKTLLSERVSGRFSTELTWQTDERGSIYSEELLCHPLK